jgi:hypothetical protein
VNFSLISNSVTVHAVGSASSLNQDGDILAYLGNHYTDTTGVATAEMQTGELLGITNTGALRAYRDGTGGASQAALHSAGFFSATSVYDSWWHRMYVDAQTPVKLNNISTYGSGSSRPAEFFAYNFVVGWDKDNGANLHWNGNMSEVLLYDYALSDTSSAQLTKEDITFYNTNH